MIHEVEVVSSNSSSSNSYAPTQVTGSLHPSDVLLHLCCVIGIRERFLRNRNPQELTQRFPAILHLKHQESVSRDLPLDLFLPLSEESDRRLLSAVHSAKHSSRVAGAEVCRGETGEALSLGVVPYEFDQPGL